MKDYLKETLHDPAETWLGRAILCIIGLVLAGMATIAHAGVNAVVTPGEWDLYRGTAIAKDSGGKELSGFANEGLCVDAAKSLGVARSYTCRTRTGVAITVTVDPPSCTAPQPPLETRNGACPEGTNGSWTQSRSYVSAPYPTCWTAGPWSPDTAPAGTCSTPPPPPDPVPVVGAVLDDFSAPMRTLGGHNLWDNYGGEGASATTLVTNGKLEYRMTGGAPYMHFFSNDGSVWKYARQFVPNYTLGKYNRLTFWVFQPTTVKPETGPGYQTQLGTYARASNESASVQGAIHGYHYYNLRSGVWSKIVLDNHPQHLVGGGSKDPGMQGSNYIDSLTRFYWNTADIQLTSYPSSILFDDFAFTTDADSAAEVASLEASYDGKVLHVGFCRSTSADVAYTAKWSLDGVTWNTLGTVAADGNGDYVNKKIEGTVALGQAPVVFISVQKAGSSVVRKMQLELGAH